MLVLAALKYALLVLALKGLVGATRNAVVQLVLSAHEIQIRVLLIASV